MRCVNINHPEFKELLQQSDLDPISLAADVSIWQDRNNTDLFPTLEQLVPSVEKVEYRFVAVDKILAKLPILNKWWNTLPRDTFWKKFKELGIPNEQVELYQESNADTFEQVVVDTLAKYSFEVEIQRGVKKESSSDYATNFVYEGFVYRYSKIKNDYHKFKVLGNPNAPEIDFDLDNPVSISEQEYLKALNNTSKSFSNYYKDLTVPGGTNYKELEIKTSNITPSIKGHAEFSTDQGIGWFRVDELEGGKQVRRILELQSDVFQKGRDKSNLIDKENLTGETLGDSFILDSFKYVALLEDDIYTKAPIEDKNNYNQITKKEYEDSLKEYNKDKLTKLNKTENKFLQLLNKDGNWIKFFIQSIVQRTRKEVVYEKSLPDIEAKPVPKYKNILFPAGETAAKIEGHETLSSILNYLNYAIANPQGYEALGIWSYEDRMVNIEEESEKAFIKALTKERDNLKTQGLEKLKPIEGFYEIRVQNILKKLYPDNVVRITDEYGNDWFSVNLYDDRTGQVFFQKDKASESKVSEAKLKSLLERTGFSLVTLQEYENITGKTYDVNALVDMSARLVAIAEGASIGSALTEELAHIAVAQSRGTTEYNTAMKLLDSTEEYEEFYDQYMEEYKNDLFVREEILGKILMKDLESKLGTSIGMWLRRLWNKFIKLFKNKDLYDYVGYITDQFITNPEKEVKGDGIFFQSKKEEKTLQQQVNKLNRRYKDLAKRKKEDPSLLPQIRALEEELEGNKNGVGIYKFLLLLNEDTRRNIDYLKDYFTITEKEDRNFLGARTNKETPSDLIITQLAKYIGYYLPFLKELNSVLDEDSVIGSERKVLLDEMIRIHTENFEVINRAYKQFLREITNENYEKDQLELTGQIVSPLSSLREAPRDSNFWETWFGLARNNSDDLVRIVHRLVFDLKNKIRRTVLNWSDDFLANSIDYIGKDVSWIAERVTVKVTDKKGNVTTKIQKSGNFISDVHQGQWELAREEFHTNLHDKYGFSQDFAERLKEKKTIQGYAGVDAFQKAEIQRLKDYNQEIAKWYTVNSIPNPRKDEIIAERKAALSPEQFQFWKSRNMELNKDGSVRYYKGELVSPSRGTTKTIEYGDKITKVKTVDWSNKDYNKLTDKDKTFLQYLKDQKKEMDKSIPFADSNRLPQMYESTLDIMRLNEPEVFKRLGKNIKSAFVKEEDDTQFNDTVKLGDDSILDDVPIRFTSLLSEPDRISTDILSSMIAYKQMQENYIQMSRELPKYENYLQVSKRRVVNTGNKVIEGKDSWSFDALEKFLQVHISGKEKESLEMEVMGVKLNVTKMIEKLGQWVRAKNLGFNFITMTSNLISSKVFATLESLIGNYTTVKSSAFANKEFFAILPTVISSFNGVRSTDRISSLMTYFGLGRDIREMFDDLDKHVLMRNQPDKTLMYGFEKGDYFTKSVVMIAILDNYRVKDNKWYTAREAEKEGLNFEEMTSAYNMLKVDKDGKVKTTIPESVINNLTARMKTIASRVDGSLSPEDKGAIYQNAVFCMVGIHRGWLFEGLSRRLKYKGYDFTLGQVTEGDFRTVMDLIGRFFMSKRKLRSIQEYLAKYNELEDYQKENLKRVMLELSMIAAFTIIALTLNSGDDDEEDYLRDLLAYQSNRVLLEVSSFYNPNEFVSAIKDPIVPARDLELVTNFTDMFNSEVIEKGKWEGMTKQQKYFLQLVPGIKGYSTFQDPESQNQFLRSKPLKPIYSAYEFFVGEEEK